MDWSVRDNPQQHRYDLVRGDQVAGHAEYDVRDEVMTVIHTEIDPGHKGGLGSTLARDVLDDARRRGLAVIPICPFMRRFIQRHSEYADLVPADRRAEFRVG